VKNEKQDRRKLCNDATVSKNMEIYPPDPGEEGKTFLMVDVANIGRRPTTITHVGFRQIGKESADILVADSVTKRPREVGEGKSTSFLVDQSQIVFEKLKDVIVFNAAGKTYFRKVSKALR